MNSAPGIEQSGPADGLSARALALIADVIRIADEVNGKDELPVAKLKIEVRQWVAESYLKMRRTADDKTAPEVFAVNIHTGAKAHQDNVSPHP